MPTSRRIAKANNSISRRIFEFRGYRIIQFDRVRLPWHFIAFSRNDVGLVRVATTEFIRPIDRRELIHWPSIKEVRKLVHVHVHDQITVYELRPKPVVEWSWVIVETINLKTVHLLSSMDSSPKGKP